MAQRKWKRWPRSRSNLSTHLSSSRHRTCRSRTFNSNLHHSPNRSSSSSNPARDRDTGTPRHQPRPRHRHRPEVSSSNHHRNLNLVLRQLRRTRRLLSSRSATSQTRCTRGRVPRLLRHPRRQLPRDRSSPLRTLTGSSLSPSDTPQPQRSTVHLLHLPSSNPTMQLNHNLRRSRLPRANRHSQNASRVCLRHSHHASLSKPPSPPRSSAPQTFTAQSQIPVHHLHLLAGPPPAQDPVPPPSPPGPLLQIVTETEKATAGGERAR